MSERSQQIAALFIRLQQHKDRAWKAHIGRKHRQALEQAAKAELDAMDLRKLLAEEEEAGLKGLRG